MASQRPVPAAPMMSTDARKRAVELLVSGESGGLRFVAQQLKVEELTSKVLSVSTVSRGARAQAQADGDALVVLRGKPKKALTAKTKQARIRFARANRDKTWDRTCITDRCRFYFRYPGTRVRRVRWAKQSQKHQDAAFKPNHPSCLNVYGGITKYGATRLVKVTGTTNYKTDYKTQAGNVSRNITKNEYGDVAGVLIDDADDLFAVHKITKWTWQQDNDPTHPAVKPVIAAHNRTQRSTVTLLEGWPPHSPDLSPIENVWAWVDAKVAAMGCQTFQEFEAAVMETFHNIPVKMCENLFNSMPKRLRIVEERDGEKCGY